MNGHIGEFKNGAYALKEVPFPECEAVLVRQAIARFHPATDNLKGTQEYGIPGPDNEFSLNYQQWGPNSMAVWDPLRGPNTFIFATKDHQYLMAMTKEAIGGALVEPKDWYSNQSREFYRITPVTVNDFMQTRSFY